MQNWNGRMNIFNQITWWKSKAPNKQGKQKKKRKIDQLQEELRQQVEHEKNKLNNNYLWMTCGHRNSSIPHFYHNIHQSELLFKFFFSFCNMTRKPLPISKKNQHTELITISPCWHITTNIPALAVLPLSSDKDQCQDQPKCAPLGHHGMCWNWQINFLAN